MRDKGIRGNLPMWRYMVLFALTMCTACAGPHSNENKIPHHPQGLVGILDNGQNSIFVIVDEEGLDDVLKASIGEGSDYGFAMTKLLMSNRLFIVESKTKVQVIDSKLPKAHGEAPKTRVKILEGQQSGKSGWVPNTWVK